MSYEDKLDQRREGLRAKADTVEADADARGKRADALARVMNGQPILIGHHSEKRHRRDIERMDRDFQSFSKGHSEAAELRRRADAVGTGGISSDDESALSKLQGRIVAKVERRDRMKRVNTLYRKRDAEGLKALGLTLEALDTNLRASHSWEKAPYPKWEVSNLSTSIRTDKKRLESLQDQEARADEEPIRELAAGNADGIPFRFVEDHDENRVICYFDSKPTRRALDLLKSHGWRYSPTRVAHVRKISNAAIAYASIVAGWLEKDITT